MKARLPRVYLTGEDFAEGKLAPEAARPEIGQFVESTLIGVPFVSSSFIGATLQAGTSKGMNGRRR
jgi:hypothetical protein